MKSNLLFLLCLLFSSITIASDAGWEKVYSEIENQLKNEISDEILVRFSAYKIDENEIPINNLNDIIVNGKVKFISPKNIWKNEKYTSVIVENPTWLDITVLANEMIIKTQDKHHIYLEGIEFVREEKGIRIYDFIMGS